MRFLSKDITQNRFINISYSLLFVLFVYLGIQTNVSQSNSTTALAVISEPTTVVVQDEVTTTSEETTTTIMTSIVEETTTTTVLVVKTLPKIIESGNGPPHNITTLLGCIAYYESGWGADPNVFQFIPSTWRSYGGSGNPEDASYARQEEIFWLAWNDSGPHHWAAQKGRCF